MAFNDRVEVTLGFKSDMSQINKDLDSLAAKLRAMGQGKGILGGEQAVTKEMNTAMNSASKLSTIMQKCRMDNGKLDVAAFKEALEKAGMSAKTLANDFKSLGPQGVAAFNEIAKAVQTAQVPIQKTQGILSEFATTMKNTVKWQLSSSLLHGFMSSINQAYGYSQDLNESLNNIRIVSKQSTDQMAEFAKEANKAAKELSISTTAYTDAALIFYQQGLQGEDVTARTDVVAKMSNVTKDSVDEVSSYMTAIWNNFDDGSESLEHYADVITKLGATTASSSAEIAAGLEKFAAVADVVGLSYDYATASLATVVAQTRQSADTVGTAFKTLFARIEGLKLGETLEDGVDLNKYSQALAKIGVSVLDANGQLRNMDDILEDMGAKWKTIGKEQQVALAQTVAGTRQYNQLVALMDNWDKVQENLETTKIADGELQAQADIYAQSWEAAQKRVQAAAQTIYASLMDEDFFIKIANGAEKFLNVLGKVIDALGGLKGLWPLLMTGITKLFSEDIGINLGNFVVRFKAGLDEAKGIFREFKDGFVQEDITLNVNVNNNAMAAVMDEYKKLISTITETQQAIDKTDVVHQNLLNDILQRVMTAIDAEVKARNALDESVKQYEQNLQQARDLINQANQKRTGEHPTENIPQSPAINQTPPLNEEFERTSTAITVVKEGVVDVYEGVERVRGTVEETNQGLLGLPGEVEDLRGSFIDAEEGADGVFRSVTDINSGSENLRTSFSDLEEEIIDIGNQINSGWNPAMIAIQQIMDDSSTKLTDVVALFKEMQNGALGTPFADMGVEGYEDLISELNTIIEQIEEAEQGTGATEEQVNALADILEQIISRQAEIQSGLLDYVSGLELSDEEAKELEDIIRGVGTASNKAAQNALEIAKAMANAKQESDGAKQSADELKNKIDNSKTSAELFAQSFQQVTMNASRFAMTITQINNVIEQLNDNSKSWGEKLLTVAMSAGMIGMSFKGTLGFFQDMIKGAAKLTTLIAETITGKTVELALTEATTVSEHQQTVEAEEQVALQATENVLKAAEPDGSGGGEGAGKLAGLGSKLLGPAAEGIGTAGLTVAAIVGVVLAAVVAGAVIAKIAHEVAKSNAAKKAAELGAMQSRKQEKVNKATENAEATTGAVEEFHDLIGSGASFDELRDSALKAAQATNDQTIAVLALKGSFQELDKYLTDKLLKEQKEQLDALNGANNSAEATIQAGLISAARDDGAAVDNFGTTFDIYGLNHTNAKGDESDDKLQKLLSGVTGREIQYGQVGTNELTKALMGNGANGMTSKEFLDNLKDIVNMGGAGAKGAQQILDWANSDKVKTYLEDYQNNLDQIQQVGLENAFTKNLIGQKEIKSAEEYQKVIEQIKQTAKDNGVDIDVEGFNEKVNSMALSYAELQDQAMNAQSALAVAEQLRPELFDEDASAEAKAEADKLLEVLANQINEFNESGKNYILLHPKFVADELVDEDGKINLEPVQGIIDYQQNYSDYNTMRSITDNFDIKKGFSEGDLAQISDMGVSVAGTTDEVYRRLIEREQELAKVLQDTEDQAKKLSEEVQADYNTLKEFEIDQTDEDQLSKNAAASAFSQGIDATGENGADSVQNQVNDQIDEYIKNYVESVIDSQGGASEYGRTQDNVNINSKLEEQGLLPEEFETGDEKHIEAITESVKDMIEAWEGTDEPIDDFLKRMEEISPAYKAMAKQIINVKKQSEDFADKLDQVTDATEVAEASQKDIIQTLKDDKTQLALTSSYLDTLQSAYKTLHAAMKEYAEDGTMSLDTVQALIDAGPGYVRYLIDENGQLQLNEESIKQATMAKFDYMEAQQAKIMLDQLEILTEKGVESQEWQNVAAAYADATALAAAGNTMDAVAAKARSMAQEFSGASAELLNMASSAEAFKKVFDAGRAGADKNFSKFMGVSSKGGGGKKKEKEKKDLKEYADEFDRFYPFQKVIDDLADAISDLAKEQEHMAGGELVGSIRYQNKLLQDQKKAYQELAKEQKKYQKEMQADLAKYGMSFDTASGNIVNYAQSTQAMLDQYNAAIEKYNKSAQSDADKKTLEAVEKEYEKFKKLVSNYQGILTEIQDTENNLDDIYYETIANNLKEFEIMVQVKLDIGEAQRMVNDFISKINKNFKTLRKSTEEWMEMFDTALKNAHTYIDGDLGTINVDMDALNKVKGAIDSGDYGHEGAMFASETEAIVKYKELAEQLKDDANDLYELYKQAWEDYIDAVDESIEEWQEIIDNFDDVNDTLDHYEKIIELLHGHQDTDQGYEELIALYDKQMELQLAKQATLRRQVETMQKEYNELIAQGAKENDKDVKAIRDAINDANKELQGSLESYVETMNKAFNKKAEKYGKDRMKAALGFDPDEFTESWNRAKKAQEGYYDVNERIYQLDKINRKFNQAIDNTKNIKLQKQLIKLRDEENERLEKKKVLSEADVAIAEKKLAVEQAKIALEEAQNNKSQLRLQRDSQGNWNYQFVANEDEIEDKQQALIDASYDLYETTKKAGEDCVNTLRELFTSWGEEYNAIMTDMSLNDEQRMIKLQELDTYYTGLINQNAESLRDYKAELGEATANLLLTSYELDKDNYNNMTEEQKAITDELKEHNIEDIADIATANDEEYTRIQQKAEEVSENTITWWNNLKEAVEIDTQNMENANNELYTRLQQLISEYDDAIRRSEEASGFAWSNVKQAIDDTGRAIDEVSDKVEDCIRRTQYLSDFRSRVMEIESAWYSVKDSITSALNELDDYLEKLLDVKEMQDEVKRNANSDTGSFDYDIATGSYSGNTGTRRESSSEEKRGYSVANTYIQEQSMSTSNPKYRVVVQSTSGTTKGVGTYDTYESARSARNMWQSKQVLDWDTGGYTGNWEGDGVASHNDGKLAFLHQKELILNQSDTKNILDAVQMVRDMNNSSNNQFASYLADTICKGADAVAKMLEDGIHYVTENMTSTTYQLAQAIRENGSRQFDQTVHIDASFPAATDRYEIEAAFDNLLNVASQRMLNSDTTLLSN